MKGSAKVEKTKPADINYETMRALKHDVKNQLSNILLAIEQLRYEIKEPTEDCIFYLDAISMSSARIDGLLKEVD
jgi:hypothetical protein